MEKSTASKRGAFILPWISSRGKRIFGFKITPCTQDELIDAIANSIAHQEQVVVASLNLHAMYVAFEETVLVELHELPQSLVHMDGISTIWSGWLHGLKVKVKHRTGVHDWLPVLTNEAAGQGWRVFCLGSDAEVNQLALERLREGAPGVMLEGRDGYFDVSPNSKDNQEILQQIASFAPDILVVGMGMGRQEQWIMDNLDELGDCCIITSGACLEYMAGTMTICPRWFGPLGLETVYRVVTQPRRYSHRYLVEPWLLLAKVIRAGRLLT